MDKLKPLLTYKFWIVFGLALLLPIVGWWMATGAWATGTAARVTLLDGTKAPETNNVPNETWTEAMTSVNLAKKQLLKTSGVTLWDEQEAQRKWPSFIAAAMKEVPPGGEIIPKVRELYRSRYFTELDRILRIARPIQNVVHPHLIPQNPRLVVLPQDESQLPRVPLAEFQAAPPVSKRIWEAQEDLWLLESIIQAVAEMNKGAKDASEAPIREIYSLSFHGGSRQPAAAAGGEGGAVADPMAAGAATDMPTGAPAAGMPNPFGGGMGMGGGMGGEGQQGQAASIAVDPKAVFGPDTQGAAGTSPDAMGGSPAMPDAAPMGGGMMGGTGTTQAVRRYVDDDPNMPFKTRGFVLQVAMDHRKLPQFLGELAAIKWPVTILVVNMQAHNPDLITGSSQTGGMGMGGGRMGMGGMGGGRMGMGSMMMARPTGGRGSMGAPAAAMMMPGGRMGMGEGQGGVSPQDEELFRVMEQHDRAMRDEYTADVVIAGLMTIYTPPKAEEVPPGTPPADPAAAPADPAAAPADPAAAPASPETPPAAEPGTVPADGASNPMSTAEPPAEGTTPTPPTPEPGTTPPAAPETSQPETPASPAVPPPAATEPPAMP